MISNRATFHKDAEGRSVAKQGTEVGGKIFSLGKEVETCLNALNKAMVILNFQGAEKVC